MPFGVVFKNIYIVCLPILCYSSTGCSRLAFATVKTGIEGFDALLGGGIPKGSILLISGPPGAGKTVMALQYTFNQARKGERALFVSTCELLYTINKFASPMSFFDLSLIRTGVNLDFYGPREEGGFVEFWDYSLGTIMEGQYSGDIFDIVQEKVSAHRIDHLIVDSITSINLFLGDDIERRKKLLLFMGWASRSGCTVIFTAEPGEGEGMERQLTDGIVDLERYELPGSEGLGVSVKAMEVAKLRGQPHSSGRYLYNISLEGIRVLAPGGGAAPEGDFASTGIDGLDENIVGMPYGTAWHFDVANTTLFRPLIGALSQGADISDDVITKVSDGERCRMLVNIGALEDAEGPAEAWNAYKNALGEAREKGFLFISFNGPAQGRSLHCDVVASSDGVVSVWDYGGYALLQVKKAPYAKNFEPYVARTEKGNIELKPL